MPHDVQRPRGPAGMTCPLHKKPMSEVCDTCPLWVHVRGKHPQGESEVDLWDCSLAWMPMLMIENSQMQRQTGAAVESFRNEMVKANEATLRLVAEQQKPSMKLTTVTPGSLIDGWRE